MVREVARRRIARLDVATRALPAEDDRPAPEDPQLHRVQVLAVGDRAEPTKGLLPALAAGARVEGVERATARDVRVKLEDYEPGCEVGIIRLRR